MPPESILHLLKVPVIVIADTTVTWCNRAARSRCDPEELSRAIGDSEAARLSLDAALRQGGAIPFALSVRGRRIRGSARRLDNRHVLLEIDSSGGAAGLRALAAMDQNIRTELRARRRDRAGNSEGDTVRAAARDLLEAARAPITKMQKVLSAMRQELAVTGAVQPAEVERAIAAVRAAGDRLDQLAKFADAGPNSLVLCPVSPRGVLASALALRFADAPQGSVNKVVLGEMPWMIGDPQITDRLLDGLLGCLIPDPHTLAHTVEIRAEPAGHGMVAICGICAPDHLLGAEGFARWNQSIRLLSHLATRQHWRVAKYETRPGLMIRLTGPVAQLPEVVEIK